MQWHVDIYIQTYIYSHTCHISLCTWCFSRASFRILIIYFMVMAKITTNITKSKRKLFSLLWCSRSNSKSLYFLQYLCAYVLLTDTNWSKNCKTATYMKNGSILDVQNIALLKMFYHKKKFNQLIIFRLNTDMVLKNIYWIRYD